MLSQDSWRKFQSRGGLLGLYFWILESESLCVSCDEDGAWTGLVCGLGRSPRVSVSDGECGLVVLRAGGRRQGEKELGP